VRLALLTAMLLPFIEPWNEFLWPFLVTKRHDLQPLAVALANYISTVASRAANPFGKDRTGGGHLGPALLRSRDSLGDDEPGRR